MLSKCSCTLKDVPLLIFVFFMKSASEFLKVTDDKLAVVPQLVIFQENFAITTRSSLALKSQLSIRGKSEGVLCLFATYYLMDLTYASSFGQFLGFLQEIVLGHPFEQILYACYFYIFT